jgi:chromate transporter
MPLPPAIEDAGEAQTTPPRSPGEIFAAFALISLQAFGGALALIERTIVHKKRWLDAKEFLGLYAVSQVLPGPTGISFCVMLGDRFFGLRGAIAALSGFLLVPSVIVIAITSVFQQFQHVPQVQGALHGMGAAAVGLIITTALRMGRTLQGNRAGMVVAALSFAAVGLARLPVSTVVLTLGTLSVVWAWRSLGR